MKQKYCCNRPGKRALFKSRGPGRSSNRKIRAEIKPEIGGINPMTVIIGAAIQRFVARQGNR